MAKNSKVSQMTKELMKAGNIKDVAGLQCVLKDMLKDGVEKLLEAELGYERYQQSSLKSNNRNGSSRKTLRTDLGAGKHVEIENGVITFHNSNKISAQFTKVQQSFISKNVYMT